MNSQRIQRMPSCTASYLSVVGLYLLISVAVTYPLISKLDTGIYGYPSDSTHIIWSIWADKQQLLDGISRDELVGLPFGFDSRERIFTPYSWLVLGTAFLRNEVFAYNVFILATFPISALVAYHLALKLTRMPKASFIAGLIYSFGPYHVWTARNHLTFDPQWLALFILALWSFEQRPSAPRALLAGFAYSLVVIVNPYYGFFAAVAAVVLVICRIGYHGRANLATPFWTRTRLLHYLMAGTIAASVTISTYWPISKTLIFEMSRPGENQLVSQHSNVVDIAYVTASPQPVQRGAWWIFYGSSRPWDYLLPSEDHPVFGNLTNGLTSWISNVDRGKWIPDDYRYLDLDNWWFWQDTGPGGELFLGYTGLLLSVYAIRYLWRSRRRQEHVNETRFGVSFFAILTLVALWFSMPPWIPVGSLFSKWLPSWAENWIIPAPVWYFFRLLPMFRAVVRFGVLVLLSISMLSAVGFGQILKRVESSRLQLALTAVVSTLVLFEFASFPPHTQLYPAPDVYHWLDRQSSEGTLASYPWNHAADIFYQPVHKMPLAGRTAWLPLGQFEAQILGDLRNTDTPPKLAAIGVDRILWHIHNPLTTTPPLSNDSDLSLLPPIISPIPGVSLEATFDTVQVLEVTAKPDALVLLSGPDNRIWVSDPDWAWQAKEQSLWIWNPTQQTLDMDLGLILETFPDSVTMSASLSLTPPPSRIIVDGAYVDNPLVDLAYDSRKFTATVAGELRPHLHFFSLPILPGETKVLLAWGPDSKRLIKVTGLDVQIVDS